MGEENKNCEHCVAFQTRYSHTCDKSYYLMNSKPYFTPTGEDMPEDALYCDEFEPKAE